MAVVSRPVPSPFPDPPKEDPDKWIAHQLVRQIVAAQPAADNFAPHKGVPCGQDIQLRPGAYTYALIAPGEWPTDSETALKAAGEELTARSRRTEDAAEESNRLSTSVFNDPCTDGKWADAASAHYQKQHKALLRLSEAQAAVGAGYTTLGEDVRTIKQKIREEHDTAHAKIERTLRFQAMSGGPVGVAAIVAEHRPKISAFATELRGHVATQTGTLLKDFPETPQFDGDPRKGTGIGKDLPTDGSSGKKDDLNPPGTGAKKDLPTTGQSPAGSTETGNGIGKALPSAGIGSSQPSPSSSPGRPSLPSLPAAGGGSGSSPLSGAASGGMGGPLSGLLGGGPASGVAGGVGSPASSVQGQTARAMQASMGGEFGRGLAAGANAAGTMPISPPSQPMPPQSPASPLAAPMGGSAPPVAAPATTSAPVASAAPAPTASGGAIGAPGGGPGGQMTSYGSVLPPGPAAGAGPVAGSGAMPAGSAAPPPPVGGGAGAGPGFVPVGGSNGGARPVPRDVSLSDLERARAVVADLAAASSAVHPGLGWAVGVARGASGVPEFWIASNEGASYVPAGVHVSRTMPTVGGLDAGFDAQWFGWFNPAETVFRALRAREYSVSAIATTFMSRSELIDEAVRDIAVGVGPSGGPEDAEASQPLQSRSHRLETVAPGLFQELSAADPAAVDSYARHVVGQTVFNAGPELSNSAQAVARAIISGRWPADEQWSALRQEYCSAVLMAGSQRPGIIGLEDEHQLLIYQQDFVVCRRLETVVCWEHDSPADVVYAAWQAGVRVPFELLDRV
ncbi:hypothetical protein [Mycolicibacterium boenickei]|nr:hypothetical protein [Mycolicibacterium boenickei]